VEISPDGSSETFESSGYIMGIQGKGYSHHASVPIPSVDPRKRLVFFYTTAKERILDSKIGFM